MGKSFGCCCLVAAALVVKRYFFHSVQPTKASKTKITRRDRPIGLSLGELRRESVPAGSVWGKNLSAQLFWRNYSQRMLGVKKTSQMLMNIFVAI